MKEAAYIYRENPNSNKQHKHLSAKTKQWRLHSTYEHNLVSEDVSARFARPAYKFCFLFLSIVRVLSKKSARTVDFLFSITAQPGLICTQSIGNLHSKRPTTTAS